MLRAKQRLQRSRTLVRVLIHTRYQVYFGVHLLIVYTMANHPNMRTGMIPPFILAGPIEVCTCVHNAHHCLYRLYVSPSTRITGIYVHVP